MTSNFKSDIDALAKHYGDLVKQHGDAAEGAQYADRASQEKRMEVLALIALIGGPVLLLIGVAYIIHDPVTMPMKLRPKAPTPSRLVITNESKLP